MATEANIKVKTDSTQAKKGLTGVVDKLKGMNTAALAAGAAFAAVSTVAFKFAATVTQEFADAGDAIHKMSGRTGVAAEDLQRLNHAFELNGAKIKQAELGFKTLNKLLYDAALGTKTSVEVFDALGLSWREMAAASPMEQFKMLFKALDQVADHTTKATLAQLAFGKAGIAMLPALVDGYAGLEKALMRADELSIVLSESQIQAAADLTDAKFEMSEVWANFREEIGARLAPVFQRSFEGMNEKIRMFRDWTLKAMDKIQEFMPAIRLIGSMIKAYFAPQLWAAKEILKAIWTLVEPLVIGFNKLAIAFENNAAKAGESSVWIARVAKVMTSLGKVFNLTFLAVGLVAKGFNLLVENWRKVADAFEGTVEFIMNVPVKIANLYIGMWQKIINGFVNFINTIHDAMPDWMKDLTGTEEQLLDIRDFQLPRINELTLDWVDGVKMVENQVHSLNDAIAAGNGMTSERQQRLKEMADVTTELGEAELKVAAERANDLIAIEGYEKAVAGSATATNKLVEQIHEQMAAKIKASEIAKIAADNDLAMIEGYEQATKHAGFYSNYLRDAIYRETDAKVRAAEIAIAAAEAAEEAEKKLAEERFSQAMRNADDTQKLALAITRSIELARKEGTYDPTAQQQMYRYAGERGQIQQWYRGAEGQQGMWGAMGGGVTDPPIVINVNGTVVDPLETGKKIAEAINTASKANGPILEAGSTQT